MFIKILEKIKEYNKIIIHRHLRPDGDCIGSQMGLKALLKHNFPEGLFKYAEVLGFNTIEYVMDKS